MLRDDDYGSRNENYEQTNLFISAEIDLPMPIPDGEGPEETRAMNHLEEISSGLIREDNSFICTDNGNIVYLKMVIPEKFKINVGDIVKPAEVMNFEKALPRWFVRKYDLDEDNYFNYPEGYYQVIEIEDDGNEIVLVSLVTGERRCGTIHNWIKIGYAGVLEIEKGRE